MMPIAPPPRKSGFPIWVLIPIAIGLCGIVSFLAIWQFLTPSEHITSVAYSDFLVEVRAGHVEEISVHDRDYRFRTHREGGQGGQGSLVRHTVGPVADQALVNSLKPDDPNLPPPKIYFEK
jgi:hypothetical protein